MVDLALPPWRAGGIVNSLGPTTGRIGKYAANMLHQFLLIAGITTAAILLMAGVLHLIPRLGRGGRKVADALCRAPLLDLVITYFTAAPMILGPVFGGWIGLAAAVSGQVAAVLIWTPLHELANPAGRRGPRIVHTLNRTVGRFRNHAAVWTTALAVPLFWIVRVAQYIVYPPLTWLVRLPKYNDADWVNVSRQKFNGLVGHDLIWCLYCDWMTGIWSLGSEMLRNVESFWCPIRFDSSKKCDNCKIDFPDIENGWVRADGGMAEVAAVLERHYKPGDAVNGWFGHPVRLTVNGQDPNGPGDGRA
jgi:hypothetical protein